jgi:hypothetical protein
VDRLIGLVELLNGRDRSDEISEARYEWGESVWKGGS